MSKQINCKKCNRRYFPFSNDVGTCAVCRDGIDLNHLWHKVRISILREATEILNFLGLPEEVKKAALEEYQSCPMCSYPFIVCRAFELNSEHHKYAVEIHCLSCRNLSQEPIHTENCCQNGVANEPA